MMEERVALAELEAQIRAGLEKQATFRDQILEFLEEQAILKDQALQFLEEKGEQNWPQPPEDNIQPPSSETQRTNQTLQSSHPESNEEIIDYIRTVPWWARNETYSFRTLFHPVDEQSSINSCLSRERKIPSHGSASPMHATNI